MNTEDIFARIAGACSGLSQEDIRAAVDAFQNPGLPSPGKEASELDFLVASEGVEGEWGNCLSDDMSGSGYPEAFKCYWSEEEKKYVVSDPYVLVVGKPLITASVNVSGSGEYFCVVTKSLDSGESVTYEAVVSDDPGSGENVVASVPVFDVLEAGDVHQHHLGVIVIGVSGVKSICGDGDGSEAVSGDVQISGSRTSGSTNSSCGIIFTTVSETPASAGDSEQSRIIADLKDRDPDEGGWGVHTLKFKNEQGSDENIHFLGCADVDITDSTGGGSGSHSITNVVGSEYIDVTTQTSVSGVQQRKVVAKTDTANPKTYDEHALLTHDTDQFVRCAKVFTGNGDSGASKRIKIDGPNGKLEAINAGGNKIIRLDAGDMPDDCQGPITVHKIKYKDTNGDTQIYHGLFCDDIDLTKEGKLIKDVSLSPSSASGGFNKIVFTYTDDTYDEVTIQNGINGSQGPQGADGLDGETPEITSTDIAPGKHAIMADGEQIAIISDGADGTSPVITMGEGTGNPKTYKIFSNGTEIGSVHDGADGTITEPLTETNIVTDISFSVSNGKIMATVTKAKAKVINYSSLGQSNVDVCSIVNQDVVVSSSYNGTGNERKFVNSVRSVGVLSVGNASESPVFTATPLDL